MTSVVVVGRFPFGGTIDIENTKKPKPGKHQALVALISKGVCHTDLHVIEGNWPIKPSLPLIPGQEGFGELGEDTVNFGVRHIAGNAWLWTSVYEQVFWSSDWDVPSWRDRLKNLLKAEVMQTTGIIVV